MVVVGLNKKIKMTMKNQKKRFQVKKYEMSK